MQIKQYFLKEFLYNSFQLINFQKKKNLKNIFKLINILYFTLFLKSTVHLKVELKVIKLL